MNLSCMKIFESIYADYVSLTTTSTLRDMEMTLTRFTRRTEVKSGTGRGEVKGKPAHVSRFPPNARNLIPQKVYDQMRIWFDEITKPKEKRTLNSLIPLRLTYTNNL